MKKSIQRILALLGAVALIGLVFLTLFFAITGSPYFFASMFCMLALPVFIYGYIIVYRAMGGGKILTPIREIRNNYKHSSKTDKNLKISQKSKTKIIKKKREKLFKIIK